MDKFEILAKIKMQKETFYQSELRNFKKRIELLKTLKQNILLLQNEIFDALKQDLNKSKEEAYMTEVGLVLSEINYMIKHIRSFAKPKRTISPITQFPAKSYKVPSPYGIVLIISPWNYPFMLALDPLVDAIAAGNFAVVKPSATSKHTQLVIEKLLNMTFTQNEVVVVMGGREESDFLLEQDFDYIFFTGSQNVGQMVYQKATAHFTPVTLELGGKSPCIVDETANIPLTAKRIVFGKFLNCGQTCVAPDYIYCHFSVYEDLLKEIKRQIILQYSTHPIENENYPTIINQRQYDRLTNMLNGCDIVFGGRCNNEKLKIEPTIVYATMKDEIMQSEIFGPILPIVTFEDINEVILTLQNKDKPLALYVFSSSKENQQLVTTSCDFGGGCINDCVIHLASSRLGFGGVKHSGLGAYHGKVGFDTFSHYKSIVDKKTWLDVPMRYQPIGKLKFWFIRKFLK